MTHPIWERQRIDALPKQVIEDELRRVAEHFGHRKFSRREFDLVSQKCKGTTVLKYFGTWEAALNAIGYDLSPHLVNRRRISDQQLLSELKRVWNLLGHRPSKAEWDATETTYSYTTYKQRFGGWKKACEALLSDPTLPTPLVVGAKEPNIKNKPHSPIPAAEKRNVPLKLRLKVFSRDQYKCVVCGGSPAKDHNIWLEIDHIEPFSCGGLTDESNLRTLCNKCNRGKGSDQSIA